MTAPLRALLGNVNVGTVVKSQGKVVVEPIDPPGTVILHGSGSESNTTLIGWKSDPKNGVGWEKKYADQECQKAMGDLTWGWWYQDKEEVEIVSASTISPVHVGGMQCGVKNCGTFCEYAVPNMGDKFICYSCRSSGRRA